ncbi:hypothetical protein TH0245_06820 [Helicobacter pylori]
MVENLSPENIAKLEETIAPFSAFSSIEFLDITDKELEPRHNYYKLDVLIASEINKLYLKLNAFSQKRFSKMIMCRFFFASLFPQYDKMIMFDVDTLFVNDISESFFIPLETHYFGAVREKDLIAMNRNSAKDLYELRQMHAKTIGVADAFPNLKEAQILFDNYFNAGFLAVKHPNAKAIGLPRLMLPVGRVWFSLCVPNHRDFTEFLQRIPYRSHTSYLQRRNFAHFLR